MKGASQVNALLVQKFDSRHIHASLNHFSAAVEKYVLRDWDGVSLKAGKFVESITKTLMVFCGKTVGNPRQFKAGNELRQLEHLSAAAFPDVVRIVIPKACIFVYEVVNNRGGRHDAHDIDANEMDAKAVVPIISWVLAEMVRFCSTDANTETAAALIDELTNKKYPFFENVDGRPYVNIKGLRPRQVALLLLYYLYPSRLNRQDLVDAIARHGVSSSAANTAVHRLKHVIDDDNGAWKLRGIGSQEADETLKSLHN
ncbi:MAG: hypothetical protein E6K65_03080 [Nitrospirae bacterium]|nr:MAG: hypothetical protein E6K65_03080 [Nitrospirota bacterium]